MKKWTKIYFDFFDVAYYPGGEHEFIACEICSAPSVDIHHIQLRSDNGKDDINNLIALCRDCHVKAHSGELPKFKLQETHILNVIRHEKSKK
jgi:5-methylcytosine-specific restriction endonuclease McrA